MDDFLFSPKNRSRVLLLFTKGIKFWSHVSKYISFSIRIGARSIASSVIKKERQNLFFVFLIYSGVHFVRPWVFHLLIPKILEITVVRKRTVQICSDFAMIKRSISEFSEYPPMDRELQSATRRILGNNENIQRAIWWRQGRKTKSLFILFFEAFRSDLFLYTSLNEISIIWDFYEFLDSRYTIDIPSDFRVCASLFLWYEDTILSSPWIRPYVDLHILHNIGFHLSDS